MKRKRSKILKLVDEIGRDSFKAELEAKKEKIKSLENQVEILATALKKSRDARHTVRIAPKLTARTKDEIVRVIIPDSHGSAIDPVAAAAFLADLKYLDPDEIVMLGDHVDCGGFLAQHHTLGYVAQTTYSYEEDIQCANHFLNQIQKLAPRAVIHYIQGNHERRIEKWAVTSALANARDSEMLRRAFDPEFLLNLSDRGIKYYRQSTHYMGIRIPGAIKLGKCFFWHSVASAKDSASVNLRQFGANVVFGHIHREQSASGVPVGLGDIGAWCPGGLTLQQPLWQHTRPTDWTLGFGVQFQAKSHNFLHINSRIVKGQSLLLPLLNKGPENKKGK